MLKSRAGVGAVAHADPVVTIVGNHNWRWSAEQDWCDGFRLNGWQVVEVSERDSTTAELVRAAKRSDLLLWVSSSDRHSQDVLKRLGEHTTTVAWHADLYWGLSRPGWQSNVMWAAQFVFTADGNERDWSEVGVERHGWLLPGVRDRWVVQPGRVREALKCDVAFVGSGGGGYHKQWPYRSELIGQLQAMCERNGWRFMNPGGTHRKIDRGQRMTDFYRSAKVTVGDSLCLNGEQSRYWSDRVYEATGRGGVLVMPEIVALQEQFVEMPCYRWGDWQHLEGVLAGLLSDVGERERVRLACREVTGEAHTYSCRVRDLLGVVLWR